MRTLIGGIVGLALGSILLAVLMSQGIQSYWPILPVGLIAGLTVRSFAKNKHGGYAGGGLAAIATLLALLTGPLLAQKIIANQAPKTPANRPAAVAQAGEPGDEADAPAEAVATQEPLAVPASDEVSTALRYRAQMKQKFPVWDAICLAIGCLIAYEVGKGKPSNTELAEDSEEVPTDEENSSTEENVEQS